MEKLMCLHGKRHDAHWNHTLEEWYCPRCGLVVSATEWIVPLSTSPEANPSTPNRVKGEGRQVKAEAV